MKVPELLKIREIASGSLVLMSLRHRPPKIEQVLPQDKWKYIQQIQARHKNKYCIQNSTELKRPDISYYAAKIRMYLTTCRSVVRNLNFMESRQKSQKTEGANSVGKE